MRKQRCIRLGGHAGSASETEATGRQLNSHCPCPDSSAVHSKSKKSKDKRRVGGDICRSPEPWASQQARHDMCLATAGASRPFASDNVTCGSSCRGGRVFPGNRHVERPTPFGFRTGLRTLLLRFPRRSIPFSPPHCFSSPSPSLPRHLCHQRLDAFCTPKPVLSLPRPRDTCSA